MSSRGCAKHLQTRRPQLGLLEGVHTQSLFGFSEMAATRPKQMAAILENRKTLDFDQSHRAPRAVSQRQ